MIELVFSDSAAGALTCVKKDGDGTTGGVSVMMTSDKDGNVTSEPWEPEPYSGPTIDGSPSDIAALWLMADIGDISNLPDTRIDLWRKINENYADMDDWNAKDDWPSQEEERAHALIGRLREAAKTGAAVRVWWSDVPGEACGFYWAMDILKDSDGPVTCVKIPPFHLAKDAYVSFNGTNGLSPEYFPELLCLERNVEPAERRIWASEWKKLVTENAPLRAMVNGRLCSAPINFYDYVLRRVIPNDESRVMNTIGHAIGTGPGGVSDWWYAWRLKEMVVSGELRVVKENKTFYTSIIEPCQSCFIEQ